MFVGGNCVSNALDFCLKLKGEERKTGNNKIFEYNFQLHEHNVSGFDAWITLNNRLCDTHIVDIIKYGKGTISLKIFIGYIYIGKRKFLNI